MFVDEPLTPPEDVGAALELLEVGCDGPGGAVRIAPGTTVESPPGVELEDD